MKRFFDKGLYFEGIKQGTLVGIIMTSLMLLGAVFTPITFIIGKTMAANNGSQAIAKAIVDGTSFNPAMIISFILFAPILTLVLFSFLNKRNTSDFYHALPHKRETVFLSFFAAIITWIVFAMLINGAVSAIIYAFGAKYIMLNVFSVLIMFFNMLAASILVTAVTALAMSITGTGFSNVIVGLLILFFPRVVLAVFTQLIMSSTTILPIEAFGLFGDVSYNIPANLVLGIFTNASNFLGIFNDFASGIYTLILGLIYLAGAAILFKKRKSEMAASAAPNKLMQNVYRVALSFVICLIPCSMLVATFTRNYGLSSNAGTFVGIAILYGFALIIYFAYELITTRKWFNLVKALPALGVLVLLNVLFVGGVLGANSVILNTTLSAGDISAITIGQQDTPHGNSQVKTYERLVAEKIKITDTSLNELIATSLKDTQESVKIGNSNTTFYDGYISNDPTIWQSVTIYKKNGGKTYRNIQFPLSKQPQLVEALAKNEDYKNAILTLPTKNISLSSNASTQLNDAQLNDVYATLREEVANMDFQTWYNLLNDTAYKMSYMGSYVAGPSIASSQLLNPATQDLGFSIDVTGSIGIENYLSTYPITTSTPKTLSKMLNYINESQRTNGIDDIKQIDGEKVGYYLTINDYNFTNSNGNLLNRNTVDYSYYNGMPADGAKSSEIPAQLLTQLKQELDLQSEQPVDASKPLYAISVNAGNSDMSNGAKGDFNGYETYYFYINASGDTSLIAQYGAYQQK